MSLSKPGGDVVIRVQRSALFDAFSAGWDSARKLLLDQFAQTLDRVRGGVDAGTHDYGDKQEAWQDFIQAVEQRAANAAVTEE